MEVKLGKRYRITNSGTSCFVFSKQTVVDDPKSKNYGMTQTVVLGYYSTLESLLTAIPEKILLDSSTAKTIGELLAEFRALKKYIKEQFRKLEKEK